MKFRSNTSKVKLKHGLIPGLRKLLESLESWDEISGIIPGVIRPTRGPGSVVALHVQYETQAGLKVLAKTGTAVQEVFFITSQPARLSERLQSLQASQG